MTDEAMLTELQGLLERATPGPWEAMTPKAVAVRPVSNVMGGDGAEIAFPGGNTALMLHQDCHLIAALRNAAPRLLELAQRGMELAELDLDCPECDRPVLARDMHRVKADPGHVWLCKECYEA